ncbi:Uncharacterised protein [Vibrio cholerae]|nr:Uncharacterised protein [Vibrio cholerae]
MNCLTNESIITLALLSISSIVNNFLIVQFNAWA